MDTRTFTADEIAEYLGDSPVTDDHEPGNINTALRIIGRHDTGNAARDTELVTFAMQSIQDWANDMGVWIEFDVRD